MALKKKQNIRSPHLQIYDIFSKSMTSAISITDRLAFLFLLPFLLLLMLVFMVAGYSPVAYHVFMDLLTNNIFYAILFFVSIAFYYHFYATFRYIFIDFGFFTSSKKATILSAWVVFFAVLVSVVVTWFFLLKTISV